MPRRSSLPFPRLRRLLLVLPPLLLLAVFPSTSPAHDATLPEAAENLAAALEQASLDQQQARSWTEEQRALLEERREKTQYLLWLEHRNRKFETYIRERERSLRLLEERQKEAETIRLYLEPYLEELVQRLTRAVQSDLPFLPVERKQRLETLRATLDTPETGLGEKLRRTLEALLVEARYGKDVASGSAVVSTEQGELQGRFLRVGRLAQYFLRRDGQAALALGPDGWHALPEETIPALTRALDMAERSTVSSPLALPASPAAEAGVEPVRENGGAS
ncbi:Protein of unknown function [Paucidesulfovibrio gracilis DSM 16080]|uniref:DUF3450 domain-containing protein n=1 Tax=Paucidesulfovibrio gracilis DSM 16080 TaxID=1121449 RepID=A0A1T4WXH1_9BACT|nr:DUF3450 domain-containing protein [Paucidesulfovibrio gracilis]SKA82050.1 Protein of unknown function [Paucidesulfovibrio gracilis DSM 16080]